MSLPADYFEQLFSASQDPWAFRTRWYETRKRQLTLATLHHQRYARVFEPACANGELSVALAPRSDHLLCMDASPTATELARQRLQGQANVEVRHGYLPRDWPEGRFDLIVLSEIGYYLDPADWQHVIAKACDSLRVGGSIVACHWLNPIAGCPQDGRQVHRLLESHPALHRSVRHEEADFLLEHWCTEPYVIDLEEETL
ncbi:SAM-dependent methyltransferase [Pseudomonas gingeri NCPPB 3146 = LMG 5327]|uniref:Class I SAM-dependent methyltransferase n=2 Tax=Pseudomonas gingeri TaxID=117681 RepID=A0A7Y7Y491_9PSED|nr:MULTISPECIES: class I SAM-dependent methyltransferase [Pseudomonas]NVZ27785.1 class I SAM-dependent methyltransferase [Pseudomonas gingeri]NWC17611.1 class I SAM-dependent methyltransferase [Pseudomonas gingeri]PNQ88015.1 SAM-dependent methyltransferase [Pseudomonas gingeri NCPPB 3146 = LMG 5327]BBP76415.1 methyltransferase [Pseudomonas sp. Ost2]